MEQPQETQAPVNAGRILSPHAAELLFWGGVLVILGYFLYYQPPQTLMRIAPHARLGRMLLLLGGAFAYGSLHNSRLARPAAVLLTLCVLQAALMAGAWVVYVFHIDGGRLMVPAMIARFHSVTLGLDLAVVFALLLLLHGAGRASRLGFGLGVAFFPAASLALLAAPLVLGDAFWRTALDWPSSEAAQRPAMALEIAPAIFSLIVLIKIYRLTHGTARPGPG